MTTQNLKIRAVCLILLLAGQECFRIQGTARTTLAAQGALGKMSEGENTLKPAGERWNEASERCTWKTLKGGCNGDGCSFRPLPLDTSLSQSCRLTDNYMLSNASSRDEFVELAAQVLEEKSEKFKNGCADAKLWELGKQLHCHRRAGRMMRSAELLSKAANTGAPNAAENQERVQRALENIAGAFGTDGKYLLELKDKVKGNMLGIAKDPTGKFKRMISTVSKLLTGSESDKEEARATIRRMPAKNLTRASKRETKRVERAMKKLQRQYKLKDPKTIENAWSDVDHLIPDQPNQTTNGEVSALLQSGSLVGDQTKNGNLVLIVAIVLILILLLGIPGCNAVLGGALLTVLVVILVLILIIMLVRVLIGNIRGLLGDSRRRSRQHGGGNGGNYNRGGNYNNGYRRGGNRRNGPRRY